MTAYEMMLSESQERMLLVIERGREQEIVDIFNKYDLEAVSVGHVTDDKMLRLRHNGEVVCELPVDALAEEAPVYHKPSAEPAYYREFQETEVPAPEVKDATETLFALPQQPTIASKEWVYDQYDYMVRTNTVVAPGSDAGVLRIRGTKKALAMTTDCNARYLYLDPEEGGKIAVAEAARNIVCSGAEPLAVTDNLNFGNPEKPEIFWQIEKAADGISEACNVLSTPVIGGNVSLYNESNGTAIYPTPVIGMVGLIEDTAHITTQHVKAAGDLIYVIGETKPEYAGSELQKMTEGKIYGKAPEIDLDVEKARQTSLLNAIKQGLVQSAHDVSEGGLGVAIAESVMTTDGLGANITAFNEAALLFSESQSRFVVSVKEENKAAFEAGAADAVHIGEVTGDGQLTIRSQEGQQLVHAQTKELERAWKGAIPCLLKSKA